jgi:hypothetical protein
MLNQLDSSANLHPLEVALRAHAADRAPVVRGSQEAIDRVGEALVDEMFAGHSEGVPGGDTAMRPAALPVHPHHHQQVREMLKSGP